MAEKKNNMATRLADEIVANMETEITRLNEQKDEFSNTASCLVAQIQILDQQICIIKESLAKGNYEKDNGKDAQS